MSPPPADFVPLPPPAGPASPLHVAEPDLRRGGRAQPRSRAAMFAVVALAQVVLTASVGELGWGVVLALATASGIGIGAATEADRWLPIPGWILAPAALVASLLVLGVVAAVGVPVPMPFVVALVVAAVALGLDWTRIDGLRALPLCTGPGVLLALLSEEPWAFPVGVVWVALAFGALSLLEADRRANQPRVQPAAGAGAPKARLDDLATSVMVAVGIALLAALVLSVPACQRQMAGESGRGGEAFGGGGAAGGAPGGSSGSASGSASGGGGGGTGGGAGEPGGEDPGLQPGSSAGEGSGAGDRRYVPDPEGRFLIPPQDRGDVAVDPDARSPIPAPHQLPLPADGEPGVATLPDARTVTVTGDPTRSLDVVIEDPREPGEAPLRLRYFERSDGLVQIDELGPDGEVRDTWFYDPEGVLADGRAAGDAPVPPPEEPPDDDGGLSWPSWQAVVVVLAVLAVLGAAVWWLLRRSATPRASDPDAPPWALALVARMEAEGSARGRPRRREESIVAYARALAAGPLPEPELSIVADIVSAALFSRAEPGPLVQRQAEEVLDRAVADHPAPEVRRRSLARAAR